MRILQFTFILALGLVSLMVTSCGEDETPSPDNVVTITILEPASDEVVSDASDVHIHIEIEATDENHNYEIELHPEDDVNDLILAIDKHEHDQKIEFEQEVDLSSYPAGTEFHLEVTACQDHDCEDKVFADVEFSIP